MELRLRLFLIILAFVGIVSCFNLTKVKGSHSKYHNSLNRFKRVIDYTRWRMDTATTEFLVKVLDEELGTSKKALPANDASAENYNVVVAGAMMPSPTAVNSISAVTKEYTRFVPPTTVPSAQKEDIDYIAPILGPEPSLPPVALSSTTPMHSGIGIADLLGLDNRNSQRDDSPPSRPQFVSRQAPAISHQVAPLGPATIAPFRAHSPLKHRVTFEKQVSDLKYTEAKRADRVERHILNITPRRQNQNQKQLYKEANPINTNLPNTPPRTKTTRLSDLFAMSRHTTPLSDFFSAFLAENDENNKYITPTHRKDVHRTTATYSDIEKPTKREEIDLNTYAFDDEERTTDSNFQNVKKFKAVADVFDNSMEIIDGQTLSSTGMYLTTQKEYHEKPTKEPGDSDSYDMLYKEDDLVKPTAKTDDDQSGDYDEKFDSSESPPPRTTHTGYDVTNYTGSLDEYYESETRKTPSVQLITEEKGKVNKEEVKIKEKGSEKGNIVSSAFASSTKKSVVVVQSSDMETKAKEVCNLIKLRTLNFNSARTLYEINTQIDHWSQNSPMVHRVDITHGNLTVMENPIYMVIVDDPTSGQTVAAKQTVMIVAGISGRDHHAVSAAMYFLHQLIERSEGHIDLLSKYRFWVIPVFNPDGYEYSITFPQRRQWIKNLQQYWDDCKKGKECESCAARGIRCTLNPCYGVNLDRNFEYQWIPPEELAAEHPCGSLYAGERQLSEPETKALAKFFHEQSMSFYAFITFKEGDVLGIMYPYSHTKNRRTFDNIYRQRALRAASAAYGISGRPYVAGQTSEFLPLYAGGIEDWVDGHLGIDHVYTIMMFRAADTYNPKLTTERVVHEAYAAIDTLLLQNTPPVSPVVVLARNSAPTARPITAAVAAAILIVRLNVIDT